MNKYIYSALCILIAGTIISCSSFKKNDIINESPKTIDTNIISISNSSPILKNIEIQKVETGMYAPSFSTSGIVKPIPSLYAEIASPFAGRIIKSFVKLGQKVEKGSPLYEISSPSFFETTKIYFAAKQEMDQALKNLNREKDLLANKVGVEKELEEAQLNYQLRKQEFRNAESALKVFQVNINQIQLGEGLIVRSPINGKVVEDNIVIGQYVKEDAKHLLIVANLSKVWVLAHVKEKDIRLIEKLKEVNIKLTARPNDIIKGRVYHIGDMLEEQTRAVEVIIECDNQSGLIKPYMYASVELTDSDVEAILVPTIAILQQENGNYVYISLGSNKFEKRMIELGATLGDKNVVLNGLCAGDEIVTSGAFYLLEAK